MATEKDKPQAKRSASTDDYLPQVYDELRAIAARYLRRERAGHTLQATALVHECILKFSNGADVCWENRAHFLRTAARAIRQVLVDHAIAHRRIKRGGDRKRLPLDEDSLADAQRDPNLVELDDALDRLAEIDPRKARVVELRFFGGLTNDETAQVLALSARTVERDWRLARAWLHKEIAKDDGHEH